MVQIREGLTYDDVLLEPAYSTIESRKTDVSLGMGFLLDIADMTFDHPIIPANMADVASPELLHRQIARGGLALMHRFQTVEEQIDCFNMLGKSNYIGASIGIQEDDIKAAKRFVEAGIGIVCVDVAHGDHYRVERTVSFLKSMKDRPVIIAGNVATRSGARRLYEAGADVVKVGVGPGSLCTTRIETGCGVPQLTALMDVAELRNESFIYRGIIADGGIKNAGDCVKALCFADMVMVGNLFAGCKEASGFEGGNYKIYRGSSTHKTSHVEGVRASVPKTGPYVKVLDRLLEGIRSGCSYQGAHSVRDLQDEPKLIRISSAGLKESYPHDVVIVPQEG